MPGNNVLTETPRSPSPSRARLPRGGCTGRFRTCRASILRREGVSAPGAAEFASDVREAPDIGEKASGHGVASSAGASSGRICGSRRPVAAGLPIVELKPAKLVPGDAADYGRCAVRSSGNRRQQYRSDVLPEVCNFRLPGFAVLGQSRGESAAVAGCVRIRTHYGTTAVLEQRRMEC